MCHPEVVSVLERFAKRARVSAVSTSIYTVLRRRWPRGWHIDRDGDVIWLIAVGACLPADVAAHVAKEKIRALA
jgi:hypothetical protein